MVQTTDNRDGPGTVDWDLGRGLRDEDEDKN